MKKIHVSAATPVSVQDWPDIKDSYSTSDFEAIAAAAGITANEHLQAKILDVARRLGVALMMDASTPSSQQMRQELTRALELSRKFQNAMWFMSGASSNLLVNWPKYYTGDIAFDEQEVAKAEELAAFEIRCLHDVGRLERLLEDAIARIPKGKRGRPSYRWIYHIVVELEALWIEQTGSKPTLSSNPSGHYTTGAFLTFCQLALRPVLKRFEIETDLEHTVRSVVYGEKSLPEEDK